LQTSRWTAGAADIDQGPAVADKRGPERPAAKARIKRSFGRGRSEARPEAAAARMEDPEAAAQRAAARAERSSARLGHRLLRQARAVLSLR
jgi:hypothetical protein